MQLINFIIFQDNKSPKAVEKKSAPSLDEMVGSTISPMIKSTGNPVELDSLLNNETELRHRTNVCSPGKIKLSLTYKTVQFINIVYSTLVMYE